MAKIGVIGNSAGGHLALHLAVSHGLEGLEGLELGYPDASSQVDAVIALAGPCDLLGFPSPESGKTPEAWLIGGPVLEKREEARLASPLHQVVDGTPGCPVLLVHGTDDEEVPYEQSQRMLKALLEAGGEAYLETIQGGRHTKFGVMGTQAPETEREGVKGLWGGAVGGRAVAFLRAHVG